MKNKEYWLDVPGYDGCYLVSNHGRVKSVRRVVPVEGGSNGRKSTTIPERILRHGKTTNGYPQVNLSINGKAKITLIHRLVAEVFVENPNNYTEVNHKDLDKTNNGADNLEWTTHAANMSHAAKNGSFDNMSLTARRGSNHPDAKLNEDDVVKIRNRRGEISYRKMGLEYGVSGATISHIMNRRIWKHV